MWCWHHIKENLNNLCPACRNPYHDNPHAFSAVEKEEIMRNKREMKLREKEKKERNKEKREAIVAAGRAWLKTAARQGLSHAVHVLCGGGCLVGLPLGRRVRSLLNRRQLVQRLLFAPLELLLLVVALSL